MAAIAYGGHVIASDISSESQAGRDQQADMEGSAALPSLIMACLVDTCITATRITTVVRAELLRPSMASSCMRSLQSAPWAQDRRRLLEHPCPVLAGRLLHAASGISTTAGRNTCMYRVSLAPTCQDDLCRQVDRPVKMLEGSIACMCT